MESFEPNDAEVFNPAEVAHKARIEGKSWKEAADLAGYNSVQAANTGVSIWLQKTAIAYDKKKRAAALEMELARLDGIQETWWFAATHGDEKAANVVLKTIAQRTKLLGLEDVNESEKQGVSRTILVMGKKGDYANTLQDIVNGKYVDPEDED